MKTKPKTVEEILAIWEKQPGAIVTASELEFIGDMRAAAKRGVGYGWMKQVIDWEWKFNFPDSFPPDQKRKITDG